MHISLCRNLSTTHIIIFSPTSRTLSLRHQFSFLQFSCSLVTVGQFRVWINDKPRPHSYDFFRQGLRGQNPIIGYCPRCVDCSWNKVDSGCANCYPRPGGLSPLSPHLHSQGHTGRSMERQSSGTKSPANCKVSLLTEQTGSRTGVGLLGYSIGNKFFGLFCSCPTQCLGERRRARKRQGTGPSEAPRNRPLAGCGWSWSRTDGAYGPCVPFLRVFRET